MYFLSFKFALTMFNLAMSEMYKQFRNDQAADKVAA